MTAPSRSPARSADVVIVGAGPTGLALANLLGLYGVRTLVLEAEGELFDYPRGVGIDDESLRTFQTARLTDTVLPHTVPHHLLRFVNGSGRLLAEVDPGEGDFGWPRRNGFIQPLVDRAMLTGLDRFPHVEVLFSHRLTGFTDRDEDVLLSVTDADGEELTIRTGHLVGCDGGRSTVRKSIGATFEGTTEATRWLVVDVRNDPLGTPNAYLGCDPRRPYVSIGLPHGIRRFEFLLLPSETDEQAVEPAHLHRMLGSLIPHPERADLIRKRVYTHHARVASAFRRGRVLIAGDAAHLMPVWQGQGFNSGIRDAANLAWKLAAVTHGMSDEGLLDTYDAERRGHAAAMVDVSNKIGKVISPTNRLVAGVRDAIAAALNAFPRAKRYLAEMRYKPMPYYRHGAVVHLTEPDPRTTAVGRLFVQPEVATGEGERLPLDEVLGPWFAIVTWANDPRSVLGPQGVETAERLGARLVEVRPMSQLHWKAPEQTGDITVVGDVTGRLKKWFDAHPVSTVVVRPDRFVAGATIAQRAPQLLTDLAEALHLTPGGPHAGPSVLPVALPVDGALAPAE
ncbi:bifunctional 3-(3-hydroxy-phenyl)propionate/3-hydroxycinnamic acid hydroxylase [Streptomyces sp. NPDC047081]|uniref:bifunctional 3-(3-hydroxy-phenyl)propionate/3-hydroxycinnamic acid hydroxylase n=1 Tax=Streptomyces sp. NPDC047081 TaxID=3154706 RepID=UPI0033D7DA81